MNNLRKIKKFDILLKSVQEESRQIINNLYTQQDEMLVFQNKSLPIPIKQNQSRIKSSATVHQPLKNLLKLLRILKFSKFFNMFSFVFFNNQNFVVAYKQKQIAIQQSFLNANKLSYWLSHIYYFRLKQKILAQILDNKVVSVVHCDEESEYAPKLAIGRQKNQGSFLRMLQISKKRQTKYNGGKQQNMPFCVVFFKNGAQQLLTYKQTLGFLQILCSKSDAIFLKILPSVFELEPFVVNYTRNSDKIFENYINKMRKIYNRDKGWIDCKQEIDQQNNEFIRIKQLERLAIVFTCEIVAFVQIKQRLVVEQLSVQWSIDTHNILYLSNVSIFRSKQMQPPQNPQGLATLYYKCNQFKAFRVKTVPSNQGQYRNTIDRRKKRDKFQIKSYSYSLSRKKHLRE